MSALRCAAAPPPFNAPAAPAASVRWCRGGGRDDSSCRAFPRVNTDLSFCNLVQEKMYFASKDLIGNKRLQTAHDFNAVHPNCKAGFLVEMKNLCIALIEISSATWM